MWQEPYEEENIYEGEVRYENNQVTIGNVPSPPIRSPSLPKRDGHQNIPASLNRDDQREANISKLAMVDVILSVVIILLLVGLFIQIGQHQGKTTTDEGSNSNQQSQTNLSKSPGFPTATNRSGNSDQHSQTNISTSTAFPTATSGNSDQPVKTNSSTSNCFPTTTNQSADSDQHSQKNSSTPNGFSVSFLEETLNQLVADRKSGPMKSCRELNMLGFNADGVYYIQTMKDYPKTEVYCDMTSDGGGWTLVASVHESNISVKCGLDDLWSRYDLINEVAYPDNTAENIMIWHVPSELSLTAMRQEAYLRYRTTNGFMKNYGGNLKNLYEKHFPLKLKLESPAEDVLDALAKNAENMSRQIPDWYDYTYGDNPSQIKDEKMYSSYGNQVSATGCGTINYGQMKSYEDSFCGSRMIKPFLFVNVISNERGRYGTIYTQVKSYRPKSNEAFTSLSNNITNGDYKLQYHSLQFSSPGIPTACEFHFVVSNINWGSVEPSKFGRTYQYNPSTYRRNKYEIGGYPSYVVVGYILLARENGKNISLEHTDQVANIILESIMTVPKLFNGDRATKLINVLYARALNIRSVIPNWYSYSFRSNTWYIYDDKLYNTYGNQVSIGSSLRSYSVNYGKTVRMDGDRSLIKSKTSQPFIMINVILNEDRVIKYYYTQIISRRNNNEDLISQLQNNITKGNYTLQYNLIQFSYENQTTPVEFHFTVSNVAKWHSVEPSLLKRTSSYNSGIYRRNRFQIDGSPSNIIMGYLLLTRQNGSNVTTTQSDAVASIILDAIMSVDDLFNEYRENSLLVPITIDKGSNNQIMEMIPPIYRAHVEPGFLQFRAYNLTGYPNALCPGVKVKSISPEYSCIGGLSNDATKFGTCGDFAGWGGKLDDFINQSSANGFAHSQNDISSSILIFYR
ncbi:uncharacterized protein LOC120333114 [Styela clava]